MFALMVSYKCLKMVLMESKTRSSGHKNLVYAIEATFSAQCTCKMVNMFALIICWTSLKMGHVKQKTRSLGQNLRKSYVHS